MDLKLALLFLFGCVTAALAADLERGAVVLRENHCLECHSVQDQGARSAPVLSGQILERYTPASLASSLWNHAPAIWYAIGAPPTPQPAWKDADSEALFAYLYSLRFSAISGSPKRGAEIFEGKGCAGCHEITQWQPPRDPLGLAQQMWKHSGIMTAEAARKSRPRPTVTAQDLADITAYAREAHGLPPAPATPSIPPDLEQVRPTGKQSFDANCRTCHRSGMALENRLANRTYLSIAAGMWNHLPKMIVVPTPGDAAMRATVAYVWELQYLGPPGSVARGRQVFERKNCAQCHNDPKTGASTMARLDKLYTPFSMVALGWKHGRQMKVEMEKQRIRWPSLSAEDISDLAVYMNSRP